MSMRINISTNSVTARPGIILPLVLFIFAMIALMALAFVAGVRSEIMGLQASNRMQQARLCAFSGLESAAVLLRGRFADPVAWYSDPKQFSDQIVFTSGTDENAIKWRYSLVGYNLDSDEVIRFGLSDEAGKVNINVASPDQLKRLPGMTDELAAALLDWRESGTSPREGGAKDEYYLQLPQPYRCKKAGLDTIEELLLVKGFTSDIIFGEDMNRNGILDRNEDDGDTSLPIDNNDGILDRGLYPFITVHSREPEFSDSNPYQPRINIQVFPAAVLRTSLVKFLRPEVVDFIAEARQAGADFGRTPANLVGLTYTDKQKQSHTSPATVDDLPAVMDYLTTGHNEHGDGFVYGRININTAPRTVLKTIGRLTDSQINDIIRIRGELEPESRQTTAWLVTHEVMSTDEFKQVACLFTARSYQFMVESLGYCDYDGVQCRLQAVLELRFPRVQFVYVRDLSGLGQSYPLRKVEEGDVIVGQNNRSSGL